MKHGRKYQSVGKTTGTPLTVKGGQQRELDHQQTKLKQAQLEAQVAALVKQIGHQQSGS